METLLHDLTNALAAVRSYAEVLQLRSRNGGGDLAPLTETLLGELDRASDILRSYRRETYSKGDVLRCTRCNYTFTYRKRAGTEAQCRRCNSTELEKWKPGSA